MKAGSFLLRRLTKIPSQIVQVLHRGTLPTHLRFAIKHNQPGLNPGPGLCIEMRSFQCRCFWNMLPDNSVLSQSFKQAGCEVAWSLDANLNPDFNLHNPFFFAVAVGLLLESRVAVLTLPPFDAANPGQACAFATTSEGLLDLDTIAIHSNFCLGSS